MATKAFPIKLDEETHYTLKVMAAMSDVSIGQLLNLMAKSLRARLDKHQKENKLPFGLEPSVINLVFTHDLGRISDDEFEEELKKLKLLAAEGDVEWTPNVKS